MIGPGTTAKAVLRELGLTVPLLGVDLIVDGRIIGSDLSATELLSQTATVPTRLVVSPIGGQGHLFGRGNQQISPELIRRVGRDGIIAVASPRKLASFRGRPMFVDSGDRALDQELIGWIRVITGRNREVVYALAS